MRLPTAYNPAPFATTRRFDPMPRHSFRRAALLGLATIVALAITVSSVVSGCGGGTEPPQQALVRPNIILIQADDESLNQLSPALMPRTERLLARGGTTFTDYITTTPQCCPSRASLITGDYGHNNGVLSNSPGYRSLRDKGNVLPVWLHDAGYRTMHVGKFLNGYENVASPSKPAPGWDDWYTVFGETTYYGYDLYANRHVVRHGSRPTDNVTTVLNRAAVRLIRSAAPRLQPFYLELDERAPHAAGRDPYGGCDSAAIPQPRDEKLAVSAPLPKPPSFNEGQVADKPSFLRRPPLSGVEQAEIARRWRCVSRSLAGLDRGVAQVYRAVARAGQLDHTVFIFTSDNGLFHGEHRLATGKIYPYQEAIHLPLLVKGPSRYFGASALPKVAAPVASIDLAPTMLELAGAKPCTARGRCRTLDGRSLIPLLGHSGGWPKNRALLTEYYADRATRGTCQYAGVKTPGAIYIRHARVGQPRSPARKCKPADVRERYNLRTDPYELRNLCSGGTGCPHDHFQRRLAADLHRLRRCAGIAGRDPRVRSRPFCG
jgi:N-acetylglucosamine-6-sulfatase